MANIHPPMPPPPSTNQHMPWWSNPSALDELMTKLNTVVAENEQQKSFYTSPG